MPTGNDIAMIGKAELRPVPPTGSRQDLHQVTTLSIDRQRAQSKAAGNVATLSPRERAGARGKGASVSQTFLKNKRVFQFYSLIALLAFFTSSLTAAETNSTTWPDALRVMPLSEPAREINETNFAPLVLNSFRSNAVVKGIVLMPGATDEFYFFHRATTKLSATDTNLFAALTALTNQSRIRILHRPPFLLLHTQEDLVDPKLEIASDKMAARLRATPFLPHVVYDDVDWDYLRPILIEKLDATFWPPQNSRESWHFYRHSFAGWGLNGWETLEAIALSGKSTFLLQRTLFKGRPQLTFKPDRRKPGK